MWEERERQRAEFLLTLDDARRVTAHGEGRVITQESMRQLAGEVKERGRARLLAELSHRPAHLRLMAHRVSAAPKPILTTSGYTSPRKAAASRSPTT